MIETRHYGDEQIADQWSRTEAQKQAAYTETENMIEAGFFNLWRWDNP